MGASFIPDLALITVRDDIVVRSLGPRAARAPHHGRDAARLVLSPAKRAMLDLLVEVGGEFAGNRRRLAVAV